MHTDLAFAFFNFSLTDVIDIVLVALLMYRMYYLVKGTVAVNIFIGILFVYLLWLIVKYMDMRLFGSILEKFIDVGFIALIVVFQPEIRRFLLFLGTANFKGVAKGIFDFRWQAGRSFDLDIPSIVKACRNMAETKTGAIIVITRNAELNFYANTGEALDAKVSVKLLESIFYKNSPLHDGAIVISNNLIRSARCVLPVTESSEFPADLGMRHRAAVGITENSDAIAIVVSEQTGEIAVSKDGQLIGNLTSDRLREYLEKELK